MLRRISRFASAVALAALVLAGCKNGMLHEDEATVNGLRDAGGRTARVTITNFLDGRMRTISADQPDIKAQGQWYFVASGSSNTKTLPPRFITVDATSGRVNLADLEKAVWNVSITMFDKAKLDAAMGAVDVDDPAHAQTALTTHIGTAVLSGAGTVDLIRGDSDVRITLTTRGIGGNATLSLTVELHADDKAVITPSTYDVSYGLYDKVTGAPVSVGGQTTVATQAHGAATANYVYTAQGQDVPAGEYIFKVTVNPAAADGRGPWSWSDNIIVEGNLPITKTLTLPAIIGKAPAAPTNFKVYWDTAVATADEYTVRLSWDRASYNEDYFKLQIVDITGKLNDAFDQYTPTQGGNVGVTSAQQLWENGITSDNAFTDLTPHTVGKNFQSHTYPIYAKEGSLLAGNTAVEYILETGHVYAVRIASTNANGDSAWVYPNAGTDSADGTAWKAAAAATRFDLTEKAVSVFSVRYELAGYKLVKNGEARNAGTGSNFSVAAFNSAAGTTIGYLPYTAANTQGYLLYKDADAAVADAADPADNINVAWDSWLDTKTGAAFNAAASAYRKPANLVLRPNSVTGGSAQIVVDSAGTYRDSLTQENLYLKLQNNNTPPQWTANEKLSSYALAVPALTTFGISKAANGKFVINLEEQQDDYLFFDVGMDSGMDKVLDANGNEAVLKSVKYSIISGDGYTCMEVEGTSDAFMQMDGLSGDYRLYIEARSASGINFTLQIPIVVKNKGVTYTP